MGGIIKNEFMHKMRRGVFRKTRGKTYVHSFNLNLGPEDKLIGDNYDEGRSVFILAFEGGDIMANNIERICNAYADVG